jgi:hypothetical protein
MTVTCRLEEGRRLRGMLSLSLGSNSEPARSHQKHVTGLLVFLWTTWQYSPEDCNLYNHFLNLISDIVYITCIDTEWSVHILKCGNYTSVTLQQLLNWTAHSLITSTVLWQRLKSVYDFDGDIHHFHHWCQHMYVICISKLNGHDVSQKEVQ